MEDCIFCKIIKGEIPCTKIYEDDKTIVFLDINPATHKGGHTLVMPKNHYETIKDISDEDLIALTKTIKKISAALLKIGEGLNIVQNNYKVAGQLVPHIHFHLIPRHKDDGIKIGSWEPYKYHNGELEKTAEKIRKLIK